MAAQNPEPAAWKPSASSSHSDAATNLSLLAEGQPAALLIQAHVAQATGSLPAVDISGLSFPESLLVGRAALDIFLQANVTGPVVPADKLSLIQSRFGKAWTAASSAATGRSAAPTQLHKTCLAHLEVDGVSPYSHVPHLELFTLARYVFSSVLASESVITVYPPPQDVESSPVTYSLPWMRLRINIWHYKLLTQPSLGPGSTLTKSSKWSEVPTLASRILSDMDTVRVQIAGNEVSSQTESWHPRDKAFFFVEAANNYILLGRHEKAMAALKEATRTTGLKYALSGALGKRTKFQEKGVSQLVVFARSSADQHLTDDDGCVDEDEAKPDALKLNDDTLLEEIQFSAPDGKNETADEALPPSLMDMSPDNQPQLASLDQIILLTEATLKDAFSPVDALTSQEILPYAVRVLADKSTNWQIYTQALLVRSRIEVHRSRTVERGVLQLQAVADQLLTDMNADTEPTKKSDDAETESEVPAIQITAPGHESAIPPPITQVPTSFLPAPKATESAPAHVRLRYIDALSTPLRWHLESELAYAWAGVGSLTSALEIFKRLRLWAEVALCHASAAASEDEDGRGAGGEEKAKSIVRWRLFHPTGQDASATSDPDDQDVEDVIRLKPTSFEGPERSPSPPNAPRLWCILGDLDNNPKHYEQAWTISKQRYARAQKSLGEYYLAQKDMTKAREAYRLATSVNRLSPDLWGRLGDINLRLGQFDDAAEAYSRSIGSANDVAGGEDARTWSNLGSALWSLSCEVTAAANKKETRARSSQARTVTRADDEEGGLLEDPRDKSRDPAALLSKSLAAYKKGASIAHDNWRIWDNVLTLAARIQPPRVPDMVLALTHMLRVRKTEDAIDADVLAALLQDAVISREKPAGTGIYEPPRGSMERLVTRLLEEEVVPLITQRAELWSLVSRLRTWRRDYAGAIDASERAWRAAVGSSGSGLLPGEVAAGPADWTIDLKGWTEVVKRTDELVSILESWGHHVEAVGGKWRATARSAIRSVMSRGKENWQGSEGWNTLEGLMEGLKVSK
ncbi:TPR domain-containing protein [Metarhizium album ARSEF 1941]|uniref:TPR domain-containing protein n=1 Tax=Metarhizium album (strain ARSEF 1941) TaxID=1081103 RepID=A0A0B2X291_METAS|nr:TPR domain-containing protein [Metarhizium album ARSEF 1941]KHN99335.1 TPR domain-containing protein [Metarhizium album ARSEF 1941]